MTAPEILRATVERGETAAHRAVARSSQRLSRSAVTKARWSAPPSGTGDQTAPSFSPRSGFALSI
jgi:hypothetical protein